MLPTLQFFLNSIKQFLIIASCLQITMILMTDIVTKGNKRKMLVFKLNQLSLKEDRKVDEAGNNLTTLIKGIGSM